MHTGNSSEHFTTSGGCYNYYMRKKFLWLVALVIVASLGAFAWANKAAIPVKPTTQPRRIIPTSFNKSQYSLNDPSSLWVVVNKQRVLTPQSFVPPNLVFADVPLRVPGNESMQIRGDVAQPIKTMFAAAKADGVPLMFSSGYRSYTYQVGLYNSYVVKSGEAGADTFSARPGHSEHQTGLAFDVEPLDQHCDVDQCFADTPQGKWIAAHAYEYGFLLRYPADKVSVTGYNYEPWHLRYVGKPLASELHKEHVGTLEEFFGLPAAPDYSS
jgi:D-alanyl-D-alanine carboxypeptidase